jgi:hypothetical protein
MDAHLAPPLGEVDVVGRRPSASITVAGQGRAKLPEILRINYSLTALYHDILRRKETGFAIESLSIIPLRAVQSDGMLLHGHESLFLEPNALVELKELAEVVFVARLAHNGQLRATVPIHIDSFIDLDRLPL